MANPILVGEDFFALKDKHPEQQKIADLFDPEKNEAITGVFATPAFAGGTSDAPVGSVSRTVADLKTAVDGVESLLAAI